MSNDIIRGQDMSKSCVIFARVEQSDLDLLKQICKCRGEDISDFVRRAVRMELARLSYLSNEEMKALGFRGE